MLESLREDYLGKICPDDLAFSQDAFLPPVIYRPELSSKPLNPGESTTTLFAANPKMILPADEEGNLKNWDLNFSRNVGADSYLHIILPANQINILNPGSNYEGENFVSDGENMYVEIGCKVF
jgi:hypothetical protein